MWEKKPVILLVLATLAILVGTIVTMVLPFAWVNTEADRIAGVKPYTPLQLAGRDVYIREGCNNCHTQTVRPLVTEVLRYGEPSKSGEFVYDRPHLWGSRRTGPDLARIGGKYPDAWHVQHMKQPAVMIPQSNMPSYAFIEKNAIDPAYTQKKMDVLGFPYAAKQIADLSGKTEMDALVAYLQKLGSDIPWRQRTKAVVVGSQTNPLAGNEAARNEGAALAIQHCAACHDLAVEKKDGQPDTDDIGPPLTDLAGREDAELFTLIHDGLPEAGMPGFSNLGAMRIWKIIAFLKR